MRKIVSVFVLVASLASAQGQEIKKVDIGWIQSLKQSHNDTLYVINFWATWCKPCVHEIPAIDSLTLTYAGEKLKVFLVSNDMKRDTDTKLPEFVKLKNLRSEVVWMSETDPNKWINLIDPGWSGAIPATWIFKNNMAFNFFKEGEITQQELKLLIEQTIDLK